MEGPQANGRNLFNKMANKTLQICQMKNKPKKITKKWLKKATIKHQATTGLQIKEKKVIKISEGEKLLHDTSS